MEPRNIKHPVSGKIMDHDVAIFRKKGAYYADEDDKIGGVPKA